MSDWTLNRWRRYGHDRLYAETPRGTRLGYLDLKTNALHPSEPGDLELLAAAVATFLDGAQPKTGKHEAGSTEPTGCAPAEFYAARHEAVDWTDLGATPPGAAARERAVAERNAAPVRTTLARVLGVHTDERAWRIGADGEAAVAAQLAKLEPVWKTVHAVPVGENGADIDHLVIGPGGVFTVNAKHHPHARIWVAGNTFVVNGTRTHYIRNSRYEATRAARLLTAHAGQAVEVTGLIAVMGAQRGLTVREQPRDGKVVVVARKEIAGYLARLPAILSPHRVDALYDLARRSTTWRPAKA